MHSVYPSPCAHGQQHPFHQAWDEVHWEESLSPTGLGILSFSRGLRDSSPLSSSTQPRGKEMRAMELNESKQRILQGTKALTREMAPKGGDRWALGGSSSKPSMLSWTIKTGNKLQVSTGKRKITTICDGITQSPPVLNIHAGSRMQHHWHLIFLLLLLLFCL